MIDIDIVSNKYKALISSINQSLTDYTLPQHVLALASIVFTQKIIKDIPNWKNIDQKLNGRYGGYLEVATIGYELAKQSDQELMGSFLEGIKRLQSRNSQELQRQIDDISLLGLAIGLSAIGTNNLPQKDYLSIKNWLIDILNNISSSSWTSRLRQLAGDILDYGGRTKSNPTNTSLDCLLLDEALRFSWPEQFLGQKPPIEEYQTLLAKFLLQPISEEDDFTRLVIRLVALESIIEEKSKNLFKQKDLDALHVLKRVKNRLDRQANMYKIIAKFFVVIVSFALPILGSWFLNSLVLGGITSALSTILSIWAFDSFLEKKILPYVYTSYDFDIKKYSELIELTSPSR